MLRRGIVAIAAVVGVMVLLASSAGADCGPTYDPPSGGYATYFSGSSGGQIQCAARFTGYSFVTFYGVTSATAKSKAQKDLFCSNSFLLPAGWINATAYIQRLIDGEWSTIVTGEVKTNLNYTSSTPVSDAALLNTYGTRALSAHNVISAGAWRSTLRVKGC